MDHIITALPLWKSNVINVTFPETSPHNASSSGSITSTTTEAPSLFACQAVPGEPIPFPSCYTWTEIILFAFFMAIVMFIIVFGNLLVIISIVTNPALKTVQNYLLVSLAVADCAVGALIMPFSLANELMGYWAFGDLLCDTWLALDVLLCTASIFSLCAISLDRYWSVTQAVTYLQRRTLRHAVQMIAAVWISSLIISVPPLLGWRNPSNATEIVTFDNATVRHSTFVKTCSVGGDTSVYVIFSSLGSFWIPIAVLGYVYARIYVVAKTRARAQSSSVARTASGRPLPRLSVAVTLPTPASKYQDSHVEAPTRQTTLEVIDIQRNTTSTTQSSSSARNAERRPLLHRQNLRPLDSDMQSSSVADRRMEESTFYPDSRSPTSGESPASSAHLRSGTKKDSSTQTDPPFTDRERPAYFDDDEFADSGSIMLLSEYDFDERWKEIFARHSSFSEPVSSGPVVAPFPNGDIGRTNVVIISTESVPFFRRLLQYFSPSCFRRFGGSTVGSYRLQINREPVIKRKKSKVKTQRERSDRRKTSVDLRSEGERRKKRIQKLKERRATLVVTLVIATFVACWMPFFVILPLQAICGTLNCPIHPTVFSTVFWLGYFNSALNPLIYTAFQRDFRKAFLRVLLGTTYARKNQTRKQRLGV